MPLTIRLSIQNAKVENRHNSDKSNPKLTKKIIQITYTLVEVPNCVQKPNSKGSSNNLLPSFQYGSNNVERDVKHQTRKACHTDRQAQSSMPSKLLRSWGQDDKPYFLGKIIKTISLQNHWSFYFFFFINFLLLCR